jgi:hypothetical protein
MFRGAPVQFDQLRKQDPFTDVSMSLDLPMVTIWDRPGYGDLDWLIPYTDIDVEWENTGAFDFKWKWEGYVVSANFNLTGESSSYTLEVKGALYKLDNYLAAPSFPPRPIPYELLIKRAFNNPEHYAGLANLKVKFPDDWDKVVPEWDDPGYLRYLKPWGVTAGQKWTGLTSRQTGSWDPVLTGYIQGLLSVMFDEGGAQWTIRNNAGRSPVLYLRRVPDGSDPNIVEIDMTSPGVEMSGSRDFTQSANVIFGQGQDIAGVVFSGMEISPDGRTTTYEPFAAMPSVYPLTRNPRRNKNLTAKQAHIKFPAGLDGVQAQRLAQSQLQRFADPGITGSLTLSTDARLASGEPFPRFLISAGSTLRLLGVLGRPEGILVHASETVVGKDGSISITYDSKYRDQLTVSEVRARTRDALTPLRSLQVGKYSNTVQDLILPWSYEEGSGAVPMGSRKFWEKLPQGAQFPYEAWTTRFPPKDYPNFYTRIGPKDRNNADGNWAGDPMNNPYVSFRTMYRELFDAGGPDDEGPVDKVVTMYFQDTSPNTPDVNDVWMDTDRNRKKFRWSGSKWKELFDPTFTRLIETIPDDFTGSAKLSFKADEPTSPEVQDIWIERPSGTTYRYFDNGSTTDFHEIPPAPYNRIKKRAIPLRLAQAGTIRLSQMAAYDRNGNVVPVRFHVSVYSTPGITTGAMPRLRENEEGDLIRYLHPIGGDNYKAGQANPFQQDAWEQVYEDGTIPDNTLALLPAGVGFLVGWGNFYEPAGYSPGRATRGNDRTGMLRDEATWGFDQSQYLDKRADANFQNNVDEAMASVMIYCDDQEDEPIFFMGRFFRQEPGQS